jgi:preprotein translocase subunit SecA
MEQNQIKDLESPIKEFIPFNKSILDINAGDLRPMARQLGVSLNIDEPENKPYLMKEFNLSETDMDRFFGSCHSRNQSTGIKCPQTR